MRGGLGGGGGLRLPPDPSVRLVPDLAAQRTSPRRCCSSRVVGLLVGELAAHGRRDRQAAALGPARDRPPARPEELQRIAERRGPRLRSHCGGRRAAGAAEPGRTAGFVREQPSGKGAWIGPDGTGSASTRCGGRRGRVGLPTQHVELAVHGGGEVVGTFILTPTPATPISHEQCMVAVALADQLGATLATQGNRRAEARPRGGRPPQWPSTDFERRPGGAGSGRGNATRPPDAARVREGARSRWKGPGQVQRGGRTQGARFR